MILLISKISRLSILIHKCGFYQVNLPSWNGPMEVCEIKTTFMGQNWQTGYFWYQEGQETLHFQFHQNRTTLKFRLMQCQAKSSKGRRYLSFQLIWKLKVNLKSAPKSTTLVNPVLILAKIYFNLTTLENIIVQQNCPNIQRFFLPFI